MTSYTYDYFRVAKKFMIHKIKFINHLKARNLVQNTKKNLEKYGISNNIYILSSKISNNI